MEVGAVDGGGDMSVVDYGRSVVDRVVRCNRVGLQAEVDRMTICSIHVESCRVSHERQINHPVRKEAKGTPLVNIGHVKYESFEWIMTSQKSSTLL